MSSSKRIDFCHQRPLSAPAVRFCFDLQRLKTEKWPFVHFGFSHKQATLLLFDNHNSILPAQSGYLYASRQPASSICNIYPLR